MKKNGKGDSVDLGLKVTVNCNGKEKVYTLVSFNEVDPKELMGVVNEDSLRAHLIQHPHFDIKSIKTWIEDKIHTDAIRGCRVRASERC